MRLLDIRAGRSAAALLRARGLRADDIDLLVGASGGPKWLSLIGIDRWLLGTFLPARTRSAPLPLVGSSIGSWRMACFASAQPLEAQAQLLQAYLAQTYPDHPSAAQVSAVCLSVLRTLLTPANQQAILHNPQRQLHVLVAEAHGRIASNQRKRIALGLAGTALRNLASPTGLASTMRRVVLHTGAASRCSNFWQPVPTRDALLDGTNLETALLASGSIPLLLEPVRPLLPASGGPSPWAWYDGGIIDYHPLPMPAANAQGLILYPHFYGHLVPGWFDKLLRWRHSPAAALDRTLLIAPAAEWVASLPGGRIPDRRDFSRLDPAARQRAWQRVVAESARLGDALHDLVERGRLADQLQTF